MTTIVRRAARLAIRIPPPGWHRVKLAYLAGEREQDVALAIKKFFEGPVLASLHDGVRDLIRSVGATGARQVLLTGTPDFRAIPLAEHLGVADIIAAKPEVVDGRYTGALLEPHPAGKTKRDRAQAWLSANGTGWEHVTALANHHADRFLLQEAGRAFAVNPTERLRAYAEHHGWPTISGKQIATELSGHLLVH